nr:phospholipase-like protein [Tanacetum cinerariifolium]
PYDCRVTIRSKLKMISKIKERISSSKKRLDLFKNTVFGKWLDFNDTNYDNHLMNFVLHDQRPDLSKSVDSNILFDIAGRTLLLGRAEFCLVTDKLKKPEKNKDGELVQDKAAKGKATQPSVTIKDLGELVQKDAKWKKIKIQIQLLSFNRLMQRRGDVKEKFVPLDDLGGVSQDDESDAYTRQDGRGAIVGAKDDESDAYTRQDGRGAIVGAKVESLEAKVEKLQLDHGKMAVFNIKKIRPELVPSTSDAKEDPSDATIDGEHMDAVGHPDENEGPNEKEDPLDAAIYEEHMDTIGSPNETEEPNAQEPISHVLNTPVNNGDVLMTDAPDTINLADPPSHESEIMSPCGSEKKETD